MLRNNTHANPSTRATMRATKIRGLFFATLFFSVFTNLLMLTGPLFMLQVYDRVLSSRSEETLVALFGLVAALYFFYILLEFARGRVMARAGARFQAALNDTVFDAVIDRAAQRQKPAVGTLQDISAVREMLSGPVMLSIFDLPWTPLFLLAIFIFHPMLGWLALGGGAALIIVAAANQILTHKKTLKAAGLAAAASQFAQQAEKGAELIHAQGMGKSMSDRWAQLENAAVEETMRSKDWTGSLTALSRGFRLFLQSAILALGAWLVLQNQLTGGAMIAASILLGRALAPVESSLAHWALVQRGRAGWRNLATLLADDTDTTVVTELPAPDARLSVANLTLLPKPGDKPVLASISFELAPGEAIGVIGRSGSGKTTLARLLVGLAKPTAGEVRLNGSTLDRYGSERLGKYIGYLPQDVVLFDGTVSENIAQMSPIPDSQKVVAAARKAGVHDVITKLPDGYDTRIGMADVQLSGGQKQRLALARALYNDPILLVLDEPNSALDADGSEALNKTIEAMKVAGRAVLIMTHRPTAIYACDRLLVLDGGRQAGYGARDEIIKGMMKNAADVQRVVTRPAQ